MIGNRKYSQPMTSIMFLTIAALDMIGQFLVSPHHSAWVDALLQARMVVSAITFILLVFSRLPDRLRFIPFLMYVLICAASGVMWMYSSMSGAYANFKVCDKPEAMRESCNPDYIPSVYLFLTTAIVGMALSNPENDCGERRSMPVHAGPCRPVSRRAGA
jgi:hypothetical protein